MSELKIVKSGVVLINNVMSLKWVDFEEIIPLLRNSHIWYLFLPNEILDRIFQHHGKDRDEKMYLLLFVNKQWYYTASWLLWQRITLTGISSVKFTKIFSKYKKPLSCAQILTLNFIGKINLVPNLYISEVYKACPNLQQISFENCGSHPLNNKSLETLLPECSNLKSLTIIGSDRLASQKFHHCNLGWKKWKLKIVGGSKRIWWLIFKNYIPK